MSAIITDFSITPHGTGVMLTVSGTDTTTNLKVTVGTDMPRAKVRELVIALCDAARLPKPWA